MRILLTADTVGGVWTYALELAGALREHGVEIALATMGEPLSAWQREEVQEHPNIALFESRFRLEWMEDPWDDVRRAGDWLLELEQRVRPAVVHLNGYAHAALPWKAPVLVVGHSCVLSWWTAVRRERAPATWDRYRAAVAHGLAAADLVLAPSTAMLRALEEHYGPLPRSGVVYNGRDPDRFRPGVKEPFILTAGRVWDEGKNVGALAAIATSLDWPIFVAGEGKHQDRGAVAHEGLHQLGRLPGRELAAWLGRAAVFALPARYEPFGFTPLEAALAGCALVLGDIPSLREVWGDAAVFVPPDDPEALRSALQRLIADDAARTALAGRAHVRALRFTPQRMAAGYLAAYRSLLADRSRPARGTLACAS